MTLLGEWGVLPFWLPLCSFGKEMAIYLRGNRYQV